MPAIDDPGRDELIDLLDACERLTEIQHRLVGKLRTLGLLDDTVHLTVIARADQLDAQIDQTRHTLTNGRADPTTPPHRIPTARLAA
jgi:hypothetical protein